MSKDRGTSNRHPSTEKISAFQGALLRWFVANRREFPWRTEDASLYLIVVAELMLQRTTAAAVAKTLPSFLLRFPDWESINSAHEDELAGYLRPLGLWQRRVSVFQRLATAMVERRGEWPAERDELESLPGVGQYIANAVRLFGHGEPEPLLDVNMARVLERYFGPRVMADIRYDPYLQRLARATVECHSPSELNWAILDMGAMVCRSRAPLCDRCPLADNCRYLSETRLNNIRD